MTGLRSPGVTALLGALELKRCYYRNLLTAVLIVLGAMLMVSLTILLLTPKPRHINIKTVASRAASSGEAHFAPPPPSVETPTRVRPALPPPPADQIVNTGEFDVVSDTEFVAIDPVLPSQEDISRQIGHGGSGDLAGLDLSEAGRIFVPSPDTFISVETWPKALKLAEPKYPSIAKKAGIEGSVWIRALIDLDGSVMDAIVAKESGANAGFEEAALEAARHSMWTTALQNNQPVRVWVSYEVKFRLR